LVIEGNDLKMSTQTLIKEDTNRKTQCVEGQVKWYKPEKGYGFLIPDDHSEDIFMHFSVLDAAGCQLVEAGDRIVCEVGYGKKGKQVFRIIEIKFAPGRSKDFSTKVSQSLAFYPESLEELEGKIKWFNPIKGFGFVTPHQGGEDIFLPSDVLRVAGYASLEPGAHVLVKVSTSERGPEVRMLKVIR
jgi:cold shock protein